jgi:hypothetical protein
VTSGASTSADLIELFAEACSLQVWNTTDVL